MRKRRIWNDVYPIDNAWNYCSRLDHRGRERLGRASTHACDARGQQLPRDPSILLLLVVPRVQEVLELLRRQKLLQAVLQALLQALSIPV